MDNFWQSLPKPFFILAPMEDVTDTVFRHIILQCGRPEVFFTEFTSTDGMLSPGAKSVNKRLLFSEDEHPIVAQIWGSDPKKYVEAARQIASMDRSGHPMLISIPSKPSSQPDYGSLIKVIRCRAEYLSNDRTLS